MAPRAQGREWWASVHKPKRVYKYMGRSLHCHLPCKMTPLKQAPTNIFNLPILQPPLASSWHVQPYSKQIGCGLQQENASTEKECQKLT